ncbi:MAG: DUF2889 domain-containing protein [Alphaproteobacteria bacterium]|jgi:hypothetical protein
MPLPDPAPRKKIHTREIICHAYEREDDLWDLEAHLTDIKTYGFDNNDRGRVEAGEPIHGMWIRLTIDAQFLVHDVEAAMDHTPYAMCNRIEPDHKMLIGASIGPGWNKKINSLLGRTHGCTHMREMLGRMATVAYQAVYGRKRRDGEYIDAVDETKRKPFMLDGCHTWATDSEVVKMEYPEWYTGPENKGAAE